MIQMNRSDQSVKRFDWIIKNNWLKRMIHEFTLTSNLIANNKHILACCPGGGLRARNMARTQSTPPYP